MRTVPVSSQNFNAYYRVPYKSEDMCTLMNAFKISEINNTVRDYYARAAVRGGTLGPNNVGLLFTEIREPKNFKKDVIVSFFTGSHPEAVRYWYALENAIWKGSIFNDEIAKLGLNPKSKKISFEKMAELLNYRLNVLRENGIDVNSCFMKYTTIVTEKDIGKLVQYNGELMYDGIRNSKMGNFTSFKDVKTQGSLVDYSTQNEDATFNKIQTEPGKEQPRLNVFQKIVLHFMKPTIVDMVNSGEIEPPYIQRAKAVVENNKLAQARYDEFLADTKITEVPTIEELIERIKH